MIARARAPAALFGFSEHFVEGTTGHSHPKIGRTKTAAGSATTAHT